MSGQRLLFSLGVVACSALMAAALWFQHVEGLEPCPLCIFQRMFVIALGLVMLGAALHNPQTLGRRIYGALIVLIGVAGIVVAGRHVWLQNLPPDQVPECGPGLEYMFEAFPFAKALELVFKGSGECAEVQWTFLTLSIPSWTLIVFIAMTLAGAWIAVTRAPAR